jgi:PHD finger-like domain-containing protein 5A
MCRKQSGIAIGRLCDKCDGKCPVCDSYVRPTTLVRICDECSFGNYQNKCVVCGGEGISDAFYCFECTRLEKDRDGCPKIINLGSSRTDVSFPFLVWGRPTRAGADVSVCVVVLPEKNESDGILVRAWPGSGRVSPLHDRGMGRGILVSGLFGAHGVAEFRGILDILDEISNWSLRTLRQPSSFHYLILSVWVSRGEAKLN